MVDPKNMKKKPVRFNIPRVEAAPPRALRSTEPDPILAYPSAADLARSPEWKAWLDNALRAVIAPAALASAMGLAATGCGDLPSVDGLIGAEPPTTPVFYGTAPASVTSGEKPPVVMAPLGSPTTPGIVIASPLPDKVPLLPTTLPESVEPCPLPTTTTHRLPGRAPIATPVHPVQARGGLRSVRPVPPPPPIVPAVDPPQIDGDIAIVHPEPDVPMPGGLRPVMAEDE